MVNLKLPPFSFRKDGSTRSVPIGSSFAQIATYAPSGGSDRNTLPYRRTSMHQYHLTGICITWSSHREWERRMPTQAIMHVSMTWEMGNMSLVKVSMNELRTLVRFSLDGYMGKNWIGPSSVWGLFIVTVRSSDCIGSNAGIINEYWIETDVQSFCGLRYGTTGIYLDQLRTFT